MLHNILVLLVVIIFLGVIGKIYQIFKDRIQFFVTGLDSRFTIPEIKMLWDVAKMCHLKEPNSLYFSLPSLTRCMTQINNQSIQDGTDKSPKIQGLMTKLFNFRTKIQNESDEKKGIDSSLELDRGQRLRIILPGKGVFVSEIVNNGSNITISMPKQKNMIPVPAEDWVNKTISIYLWRNGDARYVFDTVVLGQGIFLGKLCLHLKHSSNLLRTQKRQAVRAKCSIKANLFIETGDTINYDAVETTGGYRCLLEDISECGALIRIGGKGSPNMKLKLQFNINNKLVLMFGIVRTVEYNEDINQTRLHFECIHIEPHMKNEILAYVYNMLPDGDKEVYDAIKLTDSDSNALLNDDDLSISTESKTESKTEEKVSIPLESSISSPDSKEETTVVLPYAMTSGTTSSLKTGSGFDSNVDPNIEEISLSSSASDDLLNEAIPDMDSILIPNVNVPDITNDYDETK